MSCFVAKRFDIFPFLGSFYNVSQQISYLNRSPPSKCYVIPFGVNTLKISEIRGNTTSLADPWQQNKTQEMFEEFRYVNNNTFDGNMSNKPQYIMLKPVVQHV